jgi:hypothetical protein
LESLATETWVATFAKKLRGFDDVTVYVMMSPNVADNNAKYSNRRITRKSDILRTHIP